jgi:hypothetical protein
MERNRQPSTKLEYVLEIFSSDAYFTINKKLLRHYGPEVAVFLSNLIDKYKYFKSKNTLYEWEWFYVTYEDQAKFTGLTLSRLRTCKSVLIEDNVLEVRRFGIPSKEYYRLNLERLTEIIGLYIALRKGEGKPYCLPEGYNKNKKNIIINNNRKKVNKTTIPPSIEEIKQYCQERKNNVDPQGFYDFYQSKGWFVGKNKMKDWQAAIRTWERNDNSNSSNTKNKPKFIRDPDLGRFDLHPDGEYYHCTSGERYIP